MKADIALPVVLDMYWRTVDEAEHYTNRRIAYDEFLKSHGCRKPTDLIPHRDEFDRRELIYFLSSVAVPEVMDVSFAVFKTSRALSEERLNICSFLTEIDRDNASKYADELKNITTALNIQDGLRDVDQTRVHVNTEAVARWAERQLTEDFARYKGLRKAGIGFGSPEEFQIALKKGVAGDQRSVDNLLSHPEQEGDDLLITMMEALRAEYLTNSDYGLDAYLSMRIRHGSLSGHLRGPLEQRNLIVSKDGDTNKYADNAQLAGSLGIPSEQKEPFFEAFRVFSGAYDLIIEDLTKLRLQVRSSTRPKGMIGVDLAESVLTVALVRNRIDENTPFSEFIELVFAIISFSLQMDLAQIRQHINAKVKQDIEVAFDALRSSLQNDASPGVSARLNSAIADAICEVQVAVGRVAEWFDPVEKRESAVRSFDQVVQIGIEATRNAHRGFAPKITLDIAEIGIYLIGLSDFTHILFTILDNVFVHSGNRTSPWVNIRIWTEQSEPTHLTLKLRVESEVAEGAYSAAAQARLCEIRKQMDSGEYRQRVNLEGRTGLFKLKRLVARDPRQHLDFGFIDESAFVVEIHLIMPLIPASG